MSRKIELAYTDSKQHYPSLDGLRGVAVLSVVFFHVLKFRQGWMGVDLFFVLSGFLITSILLDTRSKPGYFRNFYIKRVLRIFPLYYGVLLVYFAPILFKNGWIAVSTSLPYFLYIQNIIFTVHNSWPVDILASLNHFWSLAIEEQFYLFFPFVVFVVNKKYLPIAFLTGILISFVCRLVFYYNHLEVGGYVFTFCRMDSLLIGSLAAAYVRRFKYIRLEWVLMATLSFISLVLMASDFTDPVFLTIGFTINAIFFVTLLLLSVSTIPVWRVIFGNRWLRHFGKYSYGLYVFHHIYFILLEYFLYKKFPGRAWTGAAVVLSTLVLSYVTAYISYNFFEQRFLKLKGKLTSQPVIEN